MKRILHLVLLGLSVCTNAQNWLPVGSGLRSISNNKEVKTLYEFNGELIAGGKMDMLIGTDSIGRIARWDGIDWRQMGVHAGFNNNVNALVEYNGELYAAGQFTGKYINDGTVYNGRIARWDGTNWQPVPGATGNTATAMTVWNNKLCVAHNLQGGSINEFRISCYDGQVWEDLPGEFKGPTNYVSLGDLCVYDDKLVVAGRFDSLGTAPIRMVAMWDGSQWLDPEFPVNGRSEINPGQWIIEGYALTCDTIGSELYVGGLFTTFNHPNNEPTGLASWDGTDWARWEFGESNSQTINDIVVHEDSVFVFGEFQAYPPSSTDLMWGVTTFNPDSAYYFETTNFYPQPPVGIGSFEVMCGISFNGSVYAGGDFTHAGTNEVKNITRFQPTAIFPTSATAIFSDKNIEIYPNPVLSELMVEVDTPTTIRIINALGETVLQRTVNGRSSIDVSGISPGIYFAQNTTGIAVKLVKQ